MSAMQEPIPQVPTGVVPRRIQVGQDFQPNANPMDDPFLPKPTPAPFLVNGLPPAPPVPSQSVAALLTGLSMSAKYPKYYKDVSHLKEIDVYAVHQLFDVQDPSGAIQHASKKLLLSGVRTGGKTKYHDIQEARDTLNRWLEINKE